MSINRDFFKRAQVSPLIKKLFGLMSDHIDDVIGSQDLSGLTASVTELNYNDVTTLGTAQASKTVTADANKDVVGLRDVTTRKVAVGDSANDHTITIVGAADEAANRVLSIPAMGGAADMVLTVGAQTIGGAKTFTTAPDAPVGGYKADGVTLAQTKWVDVAVTAALLDAAGTAPVIAGVAGDQYKIRNVRLVGGGTGFGAGGDRNISLTDGTTVWTTIDNADVESAPAATLAWGDAKVPFLTGTSNTASASAAAIRFQYSGGTTDHGGVGSITFSVELEKVA